MCFYCLLSDNEMLNLVEMIFQFVTISGIILAFWQYYKKRIRDDEEGLSPKLNIQKKQDENLILFKTKVSNHTSKNIKIKVAFIVITRHKYNFLHEINRAFGSAYTKTNDLSKLTSLEDNKDSFCRLFPLNYYYDENIHVSNETLRYVLPIKYKERGVNDIQLWDVRFFVFPKEGCHRSVHSSFQGEIIDNDSTNNSSNSKLKN